MAHVNYFDHWWCVIEDDEDWWDDWWATTPPAIKDIDTPIERTRFVAVNLYPVVPAAARERHVPSKPDNAVVPAVAREAFVPAEDAITLHEDPPK